MICEFYLLSLELELACAGLFILTMSLNKVEHLSFELCVRLTHHISMMGVFISRQVSRSPHSKHSQRRHSPYSSLDTNRYVAMKSLRLSYIFGTYPDQVKVQSSVFLSSNCHLPY